MKLKLLFSFLLMFFISSSYAQSVLEDTKNTVVTSKVEFEGFFTYSINGINYLINLSITNGTYVEYDESSAILSSGEFEQIAESKYRLTPIEVSEGAILKGVVYINSINRTASTSNLEIFNETSEKLGALTIQKVQ